jgi:hypothetical protein
MVRVYVALLVLVFGGQPSQAIEVFRNSRPYNISVKLPAGHSFYKDALDRKFIIGNFGGIFRLIQDTYSSCSDLVEERAVNRAKDGFTEITRKAVADGDCAISILNPDRNLVASSFYIWLRKCDCFSAIHFYYRMNDRDEYRSAVQPILDSIRANN